MFQKLKASKQQKKINPVQNVDNPLLPGIMTPVSARFLLRQHPLSCPLVNYCPPLFSYSLSPFLLLSWLSPLALPSEQ